jgi:sugar lactone lactonase YvrE
MERDARRHADALNALWDDLSLGRPPAAPQAIGGETRDLLERLHALGDPPAPAAARARVWRHLQSHRRWREQDVDAPAFSPNGAAEPPALDALPWTLPPAAAPPARQPFRPRWAPTQLATALLVLLMLAGSLLAFGRGRFGHLEQRPVHLPAIIATPATPGAVAGPLAELVWEVRGAPDSPFSFPTGGAIDPQGNLWVTDGGNDRIAVLAPGGRVLSAEGVVLETWGASGSGDGEFNFTCANLQLAGVAFDAAGNSYVADSGNHRIQKFGPDRAFLASWGEPNPEGQPFCPLSLIVDDARGRLYVGDHTGAKIEVFALDGRPLATWVGVVNLPEQMTLDDEGNLWVAQTSAGVLTFSPEGELLGQWSTGGAGEGPYNRPMGIARDAEGRVFVAGQGARVQVFGPDGAYLGGWGSRGREPGQFSEPAHLVLDGRGNLYTVDLFGSRVQKFRLLPPLAPEPAAAERELPEEQDQGAVLTETLLDDGLPAEFGDVAVIHWTLRSRSRPLVVPPQNGPWFLVVESGEIEATEAGSARRLAPGDREQEVAIAQRGAADAAFFRIAVSEWARPAVFDAVSHRRDALIEAVAEDLPGGSSRLVVERVTLSPGSALPPEEASPLVWTSVERGLLGLTLEGEYLPIPWTAGEERASSFAEGLPRVPPGTRMTLRNAGNEPLVLYRMTLMPLAATGTSAP